MCKTKILLTIAGLIALPISIYFFNKINEKSLVLREGNPREAVVSKFGTTKTCSKTLFVKLDDREYYIGSCFGEYKNLNLGDTVKVFYIEGISDVVISGTRSFLPDYLLSALLGLTGFMCLLSIIFYKEKKLHYVATHNFSKGKINKSKLGIVLRHTIPSEVVYKKYDNESVLLINGIIKKMYTSSPDLLLSYIDEGLKNKDFKVTVILDSLLEDRQFGTDNLVGLSSKILKYYTLTNDDFYINLINDFVLSIGAEVIETKNELKRILENYHSQHPSISNNMNESIKLLMEQ